MARWFKRGGCAAFVLSAAALMCRSVRGDAPTVTGCTDSCLLTVNAARTARLSERIGLLTKDIGVEGTVKNAIQTNNLGGDDTATCTVSAEAKPTNANVQGLVAKIAQATPFNCPSVISQAVNSGIDAIANYSEQPWDNGVAAPYNTTEAQNLAYIMYPKATGLGCAVTSGCTAGNVLLICRTSPALSATYKDAPFTSKFFDALKARKEKNVDLATLTASDLNTDPDGKSVGNAAFVAIPGAIPAAALTLSSLLGFASTIHQ